MPFSDSPIIFSYTRADALVDGVLIDLSPVAQTYGFKLPFAISDALYHGYVMPPEGLSGEGQSLEGRLHDLLTLAMVAARKSLGEDRVYFDIAFLMRPGKLEKVRVVLHVGPGDSGEAVLTLCLPEDL
ncbi:DUF6573 family protein [Fundidesulfovibrio agrisoli]|uniref:DUF6573 family protein n=1 Tax=Fundidesulfovibrio agrisoli TaxID=2922717 RepID=UPI001FACD0FE|nr:DUF6573 family protein [Fundidesulfovibrio agrisoli]